jgi:phosphate transport system protein
LTSVRKSFEERLLETDQDILRMGSVVKTMLMLSMQSLTEQNAALADEAIDLDDEVDRYNLEIERHCLELLALQQPMARDLRRIAAALKIITDIERMGDYCIDIAKTSKLLVEQPVFRSQGDIPKMAELVAKMLREALEGFTSHDLNLIQHMIEDDDQVDHLYHSIHDELIVTIENNAALARPGVRLLLIARYLERLADHITNIGERVYYMTTGEIKELHE